MRVWHSPWSWLKLIVAAESVAGNTRTGMLTREILRKPFQVGRAAIGGLSDDRRRKARGGGGWRLGQGGWRMEVGGWRLEGGGWRLGFGIGDSANPPPRTSHLQPPPSNLQSPTSAPIRTETAPAAGTFAGDRCSPGPAAHSSAC